jgi:adenylate kinase family enzyme
MTLDQLGPRLCILGPSNSGKSTLGVAIAAARGLTPIHLDQLHHLPDTDWVPRPADDFAALHDAAILGPSWVMEGNYTRLLPQRLARATGVLLLDVPTSVSLYRYFRRCWFERERHGALTGGRDRVKWDMLHHIAIATRADRVRYRRRFEDIALPKVLLASPRAIDAFYRENDLRR